MNFPTAVLYKQKHTSIHSFKIQNVKISIFENETLSLKIFQNTSTFWWRNVYGNASVFGRTRHRERGASLLTAGALLRHSLRCQHFSPLNFPLSPSPRAPLSRSHNQINVMAVVCKFFAFPPRILLADVIDSESFDTLIQVKHVCVSLVVCVCEKDVSLAKICPSVLFCFMTFRRQFSPLGNALFLALYLE